MTENLCPVCGQAYKSGLPACAQCGWNLQSEIVLGNPSPEVVEAHKQKLATAHQTWQDKLKRQREAESNAGQAAVERGSQLMADGKYEQAATAFTEAIQLHYKRLRQAEAEMRYWHEHYLDEVKLRYQQRLKEIETTYNGRQAQADGEYRQALTQADQKLENVRQQARNKLDEMRSAFHWVVSGWDDPAWQQYAPQIDAPLPSAVRIGRLDVKQDFGLGDLPALLPFLGSNHLFLQGDGEKTRALLQNILLRLVVSSGPGALRFVLVDPAGSGANLAAFLRLPDTLRGAKVYSRAEEVEKQLEALVTHIETVIQTRLMNVYPDLEAYNAQAGAIAVPYTVLALVDFPAGFSERMADNLLNIARNGPKAGVYIAASLDPQTYALPRNFKPEDLTGLGRLLTLGKDEHMAWDDPEFGKYEVILDQLPSPLRSNPWLEKVGEALKAAEVDLSFKHIAIPIQERWRGDSSDGLRVPLGLNSAGEVHYFELGRKQPVQHALLGGITGSGKSNLLHVLITQLALLYSPDELTMYLLDFKQGVEFQDYLKLPHARVVALETEREFALNILQNLEAEINRRGQLFKQAGVNHLSPFRKTSGKSLPRILLVIDEYQILFAEDRLSSESQRILEFLVKQGRAYGIHVLLSSQSPSTGSQATGRQIYNQMGLRIALQCRPADARLILGDDNPAAERLEKTGEAIYNEDMGRPEKNVQIRVALLTTEDKQAAIAGLAAQAGGRYPAPLTFESNTLASLPTNAEFRQAVLHQTEAVGTPLKIWLGEPLQLKKPTSAILVREVASNLLILGGDEAGAYGLLSAALFSILAQRTTGQARIVIADFSRPGSSFNGWFSRLAAGLKPDGITVCGPREAAAELEKLSVELTQRIAQPESAVTDIYLLVAGFQRWRDLRPEVINYATKISPIAAQILRLAEEGPEAGMHLIAWNDGLEFLDQAFNRRMLKQCDLRAALRLSENDSNLLFGSKIAASLQDNRAIFRNDADSIGEYEKFKPYPVPNEQLLPVLLAAMRKTT